MNRVTVRIPTPLRAYSEQQSEIEVEADTVGEALRTVTGRHQELERFLFTAEGELRQFVNVYLDDRNVQDLEGLASKTGAGGVVYIVPAVAGGAGSEGTR